MRLRNLAIFSARRISSDVVTPSSIARPAGERFKTDQCDAMKLARLARIHKLMPLSDCFCLAIDANIGLLWVDSSPPVHGGPVVRGLRSRSSSAVVCCPTHC